MKKRLLIEIFVILMVILGAAYYALGYGFWITLIAGTKLALRKKKPTYILYYLKGFFEAKTNGTKKMVNRDQEKFIRDYRWSKMKQKIKG